MDGMFQIVSDRARRAVDFCISRVLECVQEVNYKGR